MVTTRARSSGGQAQGQKAAHSDLDLDSPQTLQRKPTRSSSRLSGQSRGSRGSDTEQATNGTHTALESLSTQQNSTAVCDRRSADELQPHATVVEVKASTALPAVTESEPDNLHMQQEQPVAAATDLAQQDGAGISSPQKTHAVTSSSLPVADQPSSDAQLKSYPISLSPDHTSTINDTSISHGKAGPASQPPTSPPQTLHARKQLHSPVRIQGNLQSSTLVPKAKPQQEKQQTASELPSFFHEQQLKQQGMGSDGSDEESSSGESSGEDDDMDDMEFSSENMLQQLANSIRNAFHAQAGSQPATASSTHNSAQPRSHAGHDGSKGDAADGLNSNRQARSQDVDIALNDDSEDELAALEREAERLQWKPDVQLPVTELNSAAQMELTMGKEKGLVKQLVVPARDARQLARAEKGAAPDTAGKAWFDLPATRISDEMKRELRLLRLRSAYDPKHHYKSFDNTAFPKYFQVGTVVEGAAEFHSSRLTNRERKTNITEELLHDPSITQHRKKRYRKLQEETQKWSKHKRRKTENRRDTARKPKPKH